MVPPRLTSRTHGQGARFCEALRFIGTRPDHWVVVWGPGIVRSGAICAMLGAPGARVPAGFVGTVRGVTVRGPVVDAHEHLQAALRLAAAASIGIDLEWHPLSAINDVPARLSRGESHRLVVLDMVDGCEMASLRIAA